MRRICYSVFPSLLVLPVAWRVWIAPVTVRVTNPAVRAMENHFRSLAPGNVRRGFNCQFLRPVGASKVSGTFLSNSPAVSSRNNPDGS